MSREGTFMGEHPDKGKALYDAAGKPVLRQRQRDDGWPTRADTRFWTPAEHAIQAAMDAVEKSGASLALTDAVILLAKARDRVADHFEGVP